MLDCCRFTVQVELPPEVMIPAPPAPLPEPVIPETVFEKPVACLEFPETVPPPDLHGKGRFRFRSISSRKS